MSKSPEKPRLAGMAILGNRVVVDLNNKYVSLQSLISLAGSIAESNSVDIVYELANMPADTVPTTAIWDDKGTGSMITVGYSVKLLKAVFHKNSDSMALANIAIASIRLIDQNTQWLVSRLAKHAENNMMGEMGFTSRVESVFRDILDCHSLDNLSLEQISRAYRIEKYMRSRIDAGTISDMEHFLEILLNQEWDAPFLVDVNPMVCCL